MAAKTILNKTKRESATECLKELHWLPIRLRIEYKIACLVFKCHIGTAPTYLLECLHRVSIRRPGLRSENSNDLDFIVPSTRRKTFAERSFSVQGPKIWNNFPHFLKTCSNLDHFKTLLKSHLFFKILIVYFIVKRHG